MTRTQPWMLVGAIIGLAGTAEANTEPPPAYDARSVGMGSTGVAHVENGASLYHNPAALQGIERGAVTGAFAPLAPKMTTPLVGPDTEIESKRTLGPLFLVGGAYRVHDRLTLGAAIFPTMGFGAKYEDVAMLGSLDVTASLGVIEIAAPGVSFAITDDLAIGLAYRMSYMTYGADTPTPTPAGTLINAETDLKGWNFSGIHAGIWARVTPTTRLGLSYRNKVTADLEGSTTMGDQDFDTSMEFSVPHIIKLGVAQGLMEDKLLLALDLRYAMYKDSNEELVVETEGVETATKLDWKDVMNAYLGAEFRPAPTGVRARVGYSIGTSATPEKTAMAVMPPPGLQHSFHAGFGLALESLDVDLGGYYMMGNSHAEPDAASGSAPGDYHFNAILGALSATYRFGAKKAKATEAAEEASE